MAHRRHILDLHNELLTNILLRLDVLELRMMRQTTPRFRNLLVTSYFQRLYNDLDPDNGERWMFAHGRLQEQPRHNWVLAAREEDRAIMQFTIDLGGELGDRDFRLVMVWNTVMIFHLEGQGLRAYNFWSMRWRDIQTPIPNQMNFFQIRIVQDPHDNRDYTLICFQEVLLGDETILFFFARESQGVRLNFPADHFAQVVNHLRNEEVGGPAFMFFPVGQAHLERAYFTSLRDGHGTVYLQQPTEVAIGGEEAIDGVPHGVSSLLAFTCPEGYYMILGVNRFNIDDDQMMQEDIFGFALGFMSYNDGPSIISAQLNVEDLLPAGLARYWGYRLQVSQGIVTFSFMAVRAGEEEEDFERIYILEYTLAEAGDIWSFRNYPIEVLDDPSGYEGVYLARIGMITRV